jgi:Family of unknown function (DUF6049)
VSRRRPRTRGARPRRIRSPQVTAARRRYLTAVLAVVLAASAGPAAPGRAEAQPAGPALEVALVAISPVVGPTTPLTYRVQVRNHGQVPLGDLSVQVLAGQPVTTRSELASLLAVPGGPTAGLAGLDGFRPAGAEVAPGATLRLEPRRVAVPSPLGAGGTGAVLPLSVRVQAAGDPGGPLTARLGTFVVQLPARPTQPLRTALLVPFHEPPHRNPANEFVDDRLADLLAPGGSLGAAAAELARRGAPPLTMVVDGLLVDEATAMRGSWRLRSGGTLTTVAAGDRRSRDAAGFLDDLRTAASRGQPAAFPYANADVPALVRNQSDTQAALQAGRTVVRGGLGTAPDQRLAWPVDGAIDAAVLRTLAAAGADVVVLDPRRLATSATTTQNATVDLGEGMLRSQRALVGDPVLSAGLADPRAASAPAEWAQRVLAETAIVWLERPNASQPRGILLAPPHDWRPTPAFFRALARGLAAAPWLRVQRASTLADGVAQGPDEAERRLATISAADVAAGLPDAYLDRVDRVRSQLASFQRAVGPGFPAAGDLEGNLYIAESSAWRPAAARPRGRAFVRAVQRDIAGVYRRVDVESTRVTLTARHGKIPITVRNDGAQRLAVVLRLSSPKVDLPPEANEPFVLEPHRRSTQLLEVGTRTTGTFPIRVDVLTPDGAEPIADGEVVLVSTAFSRVALVLSGGAAGFLLLWWRFGRRRAGRDRGDAA